MERGGGVGFGCLSKKWLSILRGQLISAFIAGTGIFATLLSSSSPNALFPQFMNTLNYLLLSSYFLRRLSVRVWGGGAGGGGEAGGGDWSAIKGTSVSKADDQDLHFTSAGESRGASPDEEASHHAPPLLPLPPGGTENNNELHFGWYVLAAVLDVEGNYLFIKAYDYTSITSVMLLDCFTIPSAMLLSYLFMRARYKRVHVVGIAICITGLVCCVVSDVLEARRAGADPSNGNSNQNQFFGDMLCILGSLMYASCNVLQEKLVKHGARERYLGNVGVCGVVIAGVQFLALDLPRMRATQLSPGNWLSVAGFVSCLFFMYTNTSSFLQDSDSVLFNLSLLTSDIYAVVFSYFRNGHLVPWLYFVAFALVALGLVTYYSVPVVEPEGEGEPPGGVVEQPSSHSLQGADRDGSSVHNSSLYNPLQSHLQG